MWIRISCTLFALALMQSAPPSRVFLMSFDGLGYQRLTEDPVAQELVTLQSLLKSGAHADGLTPAFPSSTANSHAALWTGTYAGRNGVLYNTTTVMPRAAHAFTDRVIGFRSDALTAEPLWVAAARQGVPVVAHQLTQAYPFVPASVGSSPSRDLVVINGFQSRGFSRWRSIRAGDDDVRKVECQASTTGPDAASACFEWNLGNEAGALRLRAALLRDRLRIALAPAGASVDVVAHATETEPPRARELARRWSRPLPIENLPGGVTASLAFRLFELDAASGMFLLLQTPLQESAIHGEGIDAKQFVLETGPMVGNGASAAYENGLLGRPAHDGGSGEAERRYLESLELVVRQQIAQSSWLARQRTPRLHISYVSTADDVDHTWYGLDRGGDTRYTEFRRWGYVALEHAAQAFVALASPNDHVVITSDHGMTPTRWNFSPTEVLARAGLSDVASALNTCIVLNTTDWKGGTVTPAERDGVIERVRRALLDVRLPSGAPMVRKVYASREEMASFGHDGPGGADMCYDVADGVGVSEWQKGTMTSEVNPPRGSHGLDPTRADMKAILLVKGPRVQAGRNLGPLRSAVVAALVADLLGINPPRESTFASPLR